MTVDVEDYYHVSAFEKHIKREKWDSYPSRIEENITKILDIFGNHDIKATFFILGWVAEKYPESIKKIAQFGHEIASHGYSHIRVTNQEPLQFREDISKTKDILENVSGVTVNGYRAASYSINSHDHWAYKILEECGYKYSSSVYPIKHDLYGIPDAPRYPYKPNNSNIFEIPVSTVQLNSYRIPCGGGGYFRLFPYFISRRLIKMVNLKEGKPCIFYFHPWELDTEQPRQKGVSIKTRFRHYININRTENRLNRLLDDFNWDRMDKIYRKYM